MLALASMVFVAALAVIPSTPGDDDAASGRAGFAFAPRVLALLGLFSLGGGRLADGRAARMLVVGTCGLAGALLVLWVVAPNAILVVPDGLHTGGGPSGRATGGR